MRKDNVPRHKVCAYLLNGLQQSFVVGHEDLNVITKVRKFPWRADKIWHGARRPVPNKNRKPSAAKMGGHCAADDPEADDTNVLMRWVKRGCEALHAGVIYDQTAGKRCNRQCGNLKNDEVRRIGFAPWSLSVR